MTSDPFICLAVITSPHGVSGRVKVKSFTTPPASFVDFSTLCDESGAPVRLRISGQAGGCFITTIDGITTREEAAFLRGRKLGVPRSALPEPQAGEVYLADLIGMEVVTRMGEPFGKVVRFYNFGAGDILEIRTAGGREEMFSFTEANFPSIDRARRTLTISPPDILKADPA